MTLSERQQRILKELERCGGDLTSHELESLFNVSVQTIRKDLNNLSQQGLVRRVHGGITLPAKNHNLSFANRQIINLKAKQAIAENLANNLPKESSLFLGIGTTPLQVAKALSTQQKGYTVITNNLHVALVLSQNERIKTYLSGGELRHLDQDLMGPVAEQFLARFQVNFGVFGVGGLSKAGDLLDFSLQESQISRTIMQNCERKILIADSSKLGRHALIKTGHLSEIDELYTECLTDELAQLCEASDIQVHCGEDES